MSYVLYNPLRDAYLSGWNLQAEVATYNPIEGAWNFDDEDIANDIRHAVYTFTCERLEIQVRIATQRIKR